MPVNIQPAPPDNAVQCAYCWNQVDPSSLGNLNRGGAQGIIQACQECRSRFSVVCVECHTECNRRNAHVMNTVTVVNNGEEATREFNAEDRMCNDCFSRNYLQCHQCSLVYHRASQEINADSLCNDCRDGRIENHSSRIASVTRGRGPSFLGVELEVEVAPKPPLPHASVISKTAARVKRGFDKDFVILKHDGSLAAGFEIVTCPASLAEQKKAWNNFFDKTDINGMKSWSTDTCGLHVHYSRAELSDAHIARIVCLVNASHNRNFMHVIAGRTGDRWSKFEHKDYITPMQGREKYEAVNLLHAHTIEFRIFRGTLKKESLFKALEFVDAVVKFCGQTTDPNRAMRRSSLVRYITTHQERYPHLFAFIEAKWFGRHHSLAEKFGYKPVKMRTCQAEREGEE